MVIWEEKKRLDDFFGSDISAQLIALSEEKGIPIYNVCPWQEETETNCQVGLWLRFYKPGSQLKFVIFKGPIEDYQVIFQKSRCNGNNPTKFVSDISSLIDFVLSEAG